MNAKVILALVGVGLLKFAAQGAKRESLEVTHTSARTAPVFPLRLSADRRYLIDLKDQPFQVIGDSPWSLIVEPAPAQVDQYLDDRAAKGFNLLPVNLLEHKFSTQPPKLRDGMNTHWHQPLFLTFDSETMPDGFRMPEDVDLPSTFSIEYVRAWKHQDSGALR